MARIHTHYDNLKVSRKAPQEVIRAAYKALSQKYHPDKNPGDDKAARIMAILNSAYGTLADPQRRHEHDEWIAAEEWEIEWLESTRADEDRELLRNGNQQWEPEEIGDQRPCRLTRNPSWWFSLGLCLALGCVAGILMSHSVTVPAVVAAALAPKVERLAPAPPAALAPPAPLSAPVERDPLFDGWAVSQGHVPEADARPPEVRALAVAQLVIPARAPECDMELHALVLPNGDPWPDQSGYIEGFPVGNQGAEMQIVVDNSANSSPVLVKVVDLERRSNVRHVFLLARQSMTVDKLAAGKYEVRYQNVEVGATRDGCQLRRERAATQAVVQAQQ